MDEKGGLRTKLKSGQGGVIWKVVGIIVVVNIALLVVGALTKLPLAAAVGGVGIITFFGMLMLTNYLSDSPALDRGEMRKAIAASFTAVYLALVSLMSFKTSTPADSDLSKSIVGHFTYLMGIIIIFYFASSAVRDYLKTKQEGQKKRK